MGSTPLPLPPPRTPCTTSSETLRPDLQTPRLLPPRAVRPPWPSLNSRSESLRLNLQAPSPALERLQRPTRGPRGRGRSSTSLSPRIRRTRTVCPNLLPSSSRRSRPTRVRLRMLRKLLPSILPSLGRHSRSSRRPKRELNWLEASYNSALNFSKVNHVLICWVFTLP